MKRQPCNPDVVFARNLAALDDHAPHLAGQARALAHPVSQLVVEDDAVVDLDLGVGRLYRTDAREVAKAQVDAWTAAPARIAFNPPEEGELDSALSLRLVETLRAAAEEGGPLNDHPQTTFLVVLGVGLGYHIPLLVETLRPRHVVLYEPVAEFLAQALHAGDWSDMLQRSGASFEMISGTGADQVAQALAARVRAHGIPFVDGTCVFSHFASREIREVAQAFHRHLGVNTISRGYYEDERVMVDHCSANFMERSFRLLDGRPRPPRRETAFIVGAGPSIDATIEHIKRWQGHAMVFSAGTALQVLLDHGIVPDFHVETENSPKTAAKMHYIFERHGDIFPGGTFGELPLVGSATADASGLDLFDQPVLFFRDSLSSTRIFGRAHRFIPGVGPYAANTALAVAATMGFRRIYLFGCDCGARPGGAHHSRHSYYYTRDGEDTVAEDWFATRYPANFGGDVLTNPMFEWSRQILEGVIARYAVTAWNCSDGALIAGAAPRLGESVTIDGAPLDKAGVRREILDECQAYGPGEFFRGRRGGDWDDAWDAFGRRLLAEVDRVRREESDLEPAYVRIRALLEAAEQGYLGVSSMIDGTARNMFQIAAYFTLRAGDDAQRRRLLEIFLDAYAALLGEALEDGRQLWRALARRIDAPQAPQTA